MMYKSPVAKMTAKKKPKNKDAKSGYGKPMAMKKKVMKK